MTEQDFAQLTTSRCVHSNVDEEQSTASEHSSDDTDGFIGPCDEEQSGVDPDKELTSVRPPEPQDEIIEVPDLIRQFAFYITRNTIFEVGTDDEKVKARSVYGSHYSSCEGLTREELWCARAENFPKEVSQATEGQLPWWSFCSEPIWTNFTPLWRLTLDYIFVIEPAGLPSSRIQIIKLLQIPRTEDLEPGLPRKGVTASDHLCIGCELKIR